MTIQQATLIDLELVADLFNQYRQFYRKATDLEGARAFLKERITQKESVIFLAKEGSIGIGFTQLYPIFSSVSMQRLWLLNDLFVHPEHRKKGVAIGLLRQAKSLVLRTKAKGILLETEHNNFTAKRLYEKTGFVLNENDTYYWTVG